MADKAPSSTTAETLRPHRKSIHERTPRWVRELDVVDLTRPMFIPCSDGDAYALIDGADFPLIAMYSWTFDRTNGYVYTIDRSSGRQKKIYLHHVILPRPPGLQVDHESCEKLDCRRANLRHATTSQQQRNRRTRADNVSGIKGVYRQRSGRWTARITVNRVTIRLGSFSTAEAAGRSYDEAAKKYHGEFARLNFSEAS